MSDPNSMHTLINTLNSGIALAELEALDDAALSKAEALLYNWQQLAAHSLEKRQQSRKAAALQPSESAAG